MNPYFHVSLIFLSISLSNLYSFFVTSGLLLANLNVDSNRLHVRFSRVSDDLGVDDEGESGGQG
jgi:hypothetical protein